MSIRFARPALLAAAAAFSLVAAGGAFAQGQIAQGQSPAGAATKATVDAQAGETQKAGEAALKAQPATPATPSDPKAGTAAVPATKATPAEPAKKAAEETTTTKAKVKDDATTGAGKKAADTAKTKKVN